MKADRENKGSRKSRRFFQVTAAAAFIFVALCGGGCSSRHAMTAPYDMTEENSGISQAADQGISMDDASTDGDTELQGDSMGTEEEGNMSQAFNRVGGEIFKVSEMLFSAVDSLNEAGK